MVNSNQIIHLVVKIVILYAKLVKIQLISV